jgi:peptide/nickel transport system permease protein
MIERVEQANSSVPVEIGLAEYSLRPKPSVWQQARRLIGNHLIGDIGLVVILALILVAILAPVLSPYDPTSQAAKRLLPPSAEHLLGTDHLGRDLLSRIIYGSRISLYVGLLATGLATLIGIPFGVLAGYLGGTFDNIVMRIVDILLAFPGLVLAIVLAGLLGPNITNAMIAIGVVSAPSFARVARGSVLSVKQELYVEAARMIGCQNGRILWSHVLTNILAPLIVLATVRMSTAILTEAGLSFLGLGTQPPTASWGIMLNDGRRYMELAPWVAVFPGLAIAITVLAFNFLGDGLRDALDPRLKEQT